MTNKPMLSVERELLEELRNVCGDPDLAAEANAILDKPSVQLHGEPVAYTTVGMLEIAKRLPLTGRIGAKSTKDERWNIPLFLGPTEQPAPVADHTQCEECKGWGYHENHHEGGGTECGECGGSGNSMVAVALDTSALLGLLVSEISVDDRGFYHLSGIHPNNFKRALEESGAKITSEVKSHKSPVAVVMPERMDPRDPYDSEANQWNACLDEVARLNGVKP